MIYTIMNKLAVAAALIIISVTLIRNSSKRKNENDVDAWISKTK